MKIPSLAEDLAMLEKEREAYRDRERLKRIAELQPAPRSRKDVVHTPMGTPCSPTWEPEWIEAVEKSEQELSRRCCGAHAPDERPCSLESNSKNGRCRFHGGGLGVGAPKGNSNARIHGLYARRIQQCGTHCPQWKTCPYAGDDVKALPEAKRPHCVYEREEMDTLRELDASAHVAYKPLEERDNRDLFQKPYPMHAQLLMLRENLHMLQVMVTRAANALSTKGFTTESVQQSDAYYATYEKPSALLVAHQMLTREHRLTLSLYSAFMEKWDIPKYAHP
jgi:hypothetical protein